jgi:MFS family permease
LTRPQKNALTRNVLLLGFVSFWADVSSDMVMPLLPAFLVQLGAGALALGFIEGAAEATASMLKYASGRWADRARRLLPLAVAGYALAAAVRPLLALAGRPWHVLAVRCTDRVGKGLRTSPRDKLLAASAPPERLAEAYSFHRGMDHLGAAFGPLLAAGVLALWPGRLRLVFALAAIPGALAVLALFAVREAPAAPQAKEAPRAASGERRESDARRVPKSLLFAIALFTLGNSTDALLLLRASGAGVPTVQLPLLWTLLHVARASLSWPLGRLADRAGRQWALAAGWGWYALCYLGFAWASRPAHAWALFAAYGLVAALTEGSERALVAAAVPEERRGRALGVYNLVSGLGLWAASLIAGGLWEKAGPAAALGLGALLAALAAASLVVSALRGRGRAGAASSA